MSKPIKVDPLLKKAIWHSHKTSELVDDDVFVKHGDGGEGTEELDYIDFDLTAISGEKVGRLRWNNTDKCLEYDSHVDGSMVTNQIGQETWIRVRNNTGSIIGNGKAVYVTGAVGNRPSIALAKADADATCLTYLGITTQDIGINEDGFVTVRGSVRGVDTNSFTAGNILYLSATTAGELTETRPEAPNWVIAIGICTVKSGSGEIGVQDRIIPKLSRLSDVNTNNLRDGSVLVYDNASGAWTVGGKEEIVNDGFVLTRDTNGNIEKITYTGGREVTLSRVDDTLVSWTDGLYVSTIIRDKEIIIGVTVTEV